MQEEDLSANRLEAERRDRLEGFSVFDATRRWKEPGEADSELEKRNS